MAAEGARNCTLIVLLTACASMWVFQSLPTIYPLFQRLTTDHGAWDRVRRTRSVERLALPAIVICNKLPYSLAGVNAVGDTFNQELILRYLLDWFDPSSTDDFASGYGATGTGGSSAELESIVSQLLPNAGLRQRMDQVLLHCQDFIASCSFGGSEQLSGYDCCRQVEPFLGTLNGVCWVLRNHSHLQSPFTASPGLQLTFQIQRNQYQSNAQSFHPGIELYLQPQNERDRVRLATELQSPVLLGNKKSRKIAVKKEIWTSHVRAGGCGDGPDEALSRDKSVPNSTYIPCLVEAAVAACGCVPLTAVLWTLQGDVHSSLLRRFGNISSICSVKQYGRCASAYMNFARPRQWHYSVSDAKAQLKWAVDHCRRTTHVPCQRAAFSVADDEVTDLPPEYQNTQDFVSQFTLSYSSFEMDEIVESRIATLSYVMTTLGYNFALWFAVGHAIWSLLSWLAFDIHWCHSVRIGDGANKVAPRRQMVEISGPAPLHDRTHRQLPPLNATYTNGHHNPQPEAVKT